MKLIKKYIHFGREVIAYFLAIDADIRATALAYMTLVSIVPLMVLSVGVISAFPDFESYVQKVHRFLFQHFVPSSADIIQDYVEIFARQSAQFSATGLVFSLLSAILLIFSMETTFNAIWRVKSRRRGLTEIFIYCVTLMLLPLVAGAAFALSVLLFSLPYVSSIVETIFGFVPILYVAPPFLTWVGFLFLYIALPNCTVRFRYAAIGAAFAAVFFELMKILFALYITYFSYYTVIYGAIAAVPIFLIWLYLSWFVVIFGAVIAYVASESGK